MCGLIRYAWSLYSEVSHHMGQLWQDLKYAVRLFAKSPLFTITAVLSLAIGIGINSAAFSIVDAIFLRPLPGKAPSQLVQIWAKRPQGRDTFAYGEYDELNRGSTTLSGILASSRHGPLLTMKDKTSHILTECISPNYFAVLGLPPYEGRTFTADTTGSDEDKQAIIISYSLWQTQFGGDPTLVGKSVTLNNSPHTVIGIGPKGFRGLNRFVQTDAWMAARGWMSPSELHQMGSGEFDLLGRLRPGASPQQAQAELDVIAKRFAKAYPATDTQRTFILESESDRIRQGTVAAILVMSIVALVLLICCANVAGLLLARSETRRKEIAVRLALGAGRIRLARQLLTESVLLAVLGSLLGLLFAAWLIDLQRALLPPADITMGADLRIDTRVLIFALVSAVVTAIVFGLVPALRASKTNLMPALNSEQPSMKLGWGRFAHSMFVVGEVALSMVLLVGAGLLARSFYFSRSIRPGFDAQKNLLLLDPLPNVAGLNRQQSIAYFEQAKTKVGELPGVKSVSIARRFLLSPNGGGAEVRVSIPGVELPSQQPNIPIKFNVVDSDYFQTVGTRILKGRGLSAADLTADLHVVLISQEMAKLFWPKDDAIGKHILADGQDFQIVGVVQDAKINRVQETPEPYMYFPLEQRNMDEPTLIIETGSDPLSMAGVVKEQFRAVDANVPITGVTTSREIIHTAMWEERTSAQIMGGLSLLGMLLAAVGLYGVISYIVNRRRRELGMRIALGARQQDILQLVLGQGLRLALIGMVIGVVMASGLSRMLSSELYGVRPYDLWAFLGGCVLTLLISLAASYFPARRAMKVDPMAVLRYE